MVRIWVFLLLWLFLSPRRKQPGSLLSFSAGIHQITVTFNRSWNCPVLFDICLFVVSFSFLFDLYKLVIFTLICSVSPLFHVSALDFYFVATMRYTLKITDKIVLFLIAIYVLYVTNLSFFAVILLACGSSYSYF